MIGGIEYFGGFLRSVIRYFLIGSVIAASICVAYLFVSASGKKVSTLDVSTTNAVQTVATQTTLAGGLPTPTFIKGSQESVIRKFFGLINSGKLNIAADMLDVSLAPDKEEKDAWVENFSSIRTVTVPEVEQTDGEDWNSTEQHYRITLDMTVNNTKHNWRNGQRAWWVSLRLADGIWKISRIETDPR